MYKRQSLGILRHDEHHHVARPGEIARDGDLVRRAPSGFGYRRDEFPDVYKRQVRGFRGQCTICSGQVPLRPISMRIVSCFLCFNPVSYTHLDVYKRQEWVTAVKLEYNYTKEEIVAHSLSLVTTIRPPRTSGLR